LAQKVNSKNKLKNVPTKNKDDKDVLIMDPIHGFIDISQYPVIQELIATSYFQRLRRLSQLGLTSLVYPNATHSRFAHSIGVMHVFLILFDAVTKKSNLPIDDIKKLRPIGAVSALLHDIGHGPFSHTFETIFGKNNFDHEIMTCKIIQEDEISSILIKNNINPDMICNILRYEVEDTLRFVSQLVSSELDADRLDYLMRDSFFTGMNYGRVDIQRIANTLRLWEKDEPKNYQWTIVVEKKGLSAIENYIIGRYLMYNGVYFHKNSRSSEILLKFIFERACKTHDEKNSLKKLINISKCNFSKKSSNVKKTQMFISPKNLKKIDDITCLSLFQKWASSSSDKILKDLCTRILDRKMLSVIQIDKDKYADITINKPTFLSDLVKKYTKYNPLYYSNTDQVKKTSYAPYKFENIEDVKSAKSHILLCDQEKLVDISEKSHLIHTLSTNQSEIISLIFPSEKKLLQEVKHLLFYGNK
jgi:HD superfamily phosphohydrolase